MSIAMTYRNVTMKRIASCERCGRSLTDNDSIEAGMGPVCRGQALAEKSGGKVEDFAKRDEFADRYDDAVSFHQALVLRREGSAQDADIDRVPVTNIPHLVVHHSPDGFEFGYGGSGPADLALNICQLYLNIVSYRGRKSKCYDGNCWTLAYTLHQDFKNAFLVDVPRKGTRVPFEQIAAWFEGRMTAALIDQHRELKEEE